MWILMATEALLGSRAKVYIFQSNLKRWWTVAVRASNATVRA
jgi:hypothetical protein